MGLGRVRLEWGRLKRVRLEWIMLEWVGLEWVMRRACVKRRLVFFFESVSFDG